MIIKRFTLRLLLHFERIYYVQTYTDRRTDDELVEKKIKIKKVQSMTVLLKM